MAFCDRIGKQLAAYAVGGGRHRQRGRIDRHLEACPECRAELTALDRTAALVARLPVESAPAGTWEAVRARLITRESTARPIHTTLFKPRWRLALVAIALLAIAVGLLGPFPVNRARPVIIPMAQADTEMRANLERHLATARFAPLADEAAIGLELESVEENSWEKL